MLTVVFKAFISGLFEHARTICSKIRQLQFKKQEKNNKDFEDVKSKVDN